MKVGQQPIQWPGFCLAGLLCVGLAVMKLTTEGHWSWWRVLLPFWVILGHNALYILVGLIWLSFVDQGDDEESLTIRPNPPQRYLYAGMLCFLLFTDNLVARMEVPDQRIWAWLRSGRWQLVLVFGILSVVCQLLFWSEAVCPSHPSTRRE
jgi:uncharacterized membrane protein